MRLALKGSMAPVAALALAAAAAPPATAQWTIQPSPDPEGASSASLSAVSCAADGSCMAVGTYSPNGTSQYTLAERWDGSSWTIVNTPNPPGGAGILYGVSCPAPGSCIAVGLSVSGAHVHALAETWNGRKWVIRSTPAPAPGSIVSLHSVSCTSPDSCTAVGGFTKARESAEEQPLAESWNGTRWTIEPTPNPEAENGSSLKAVSCSASDACTAAGDYDYFDVDQKIFAMRFDGTTWTMQRQPNPGGEHLNADTSISCSEPSACISVGSWLTVELEPRPLAESWNGVKWVRQATPHPKHAVSAALEGVSCLSGSHCTAVGGWSANAQGNPDFTLAEQWNGESWKVQETPNPSGAQHSTLVGIDCSAGPCVAVGNSSNGSVTQTLVERYSP
jgi:hypothetical protein